MPEKNPSITQLLPKKNNFKTGFVIFEWNFNIKTRYFLSCIKTHNKLLNIIFIVSATKATRHERYSTIDKNANNTA